MQIADHGRRGLRWLGGALLLAAMLPVLGLAAQTGTQAHKPHKKVVASKAQTLPAALPAAAPVAVAAPAAPKWPANEKAVPASIGWDSRGLRIEAANASLQQILKEVAALTGAQVEGTLKDQRVFGSYGPGSVREVLSQLLQGTGYNVLMIGDQGQGAPRQIVLSQPGSGKTGAGVQAKSGQDDDEDDDADDGSDNAPEPPQPPSMRNPAPAGGMPQRGAPGQMPERGRPPN